MKVTVVSIITGNLGMAFRESLSIGRRERIYMILTILLVDEGTGNKPGEENTCYHLNTSDDNWITKFLLDCRND